MSNNQITKVLELTSKEDLLLIQKIVERAVEEKARGDEKIDAVEYENSLLLINRFCVRLDLEKLLKSSQEIFSHDVFGLIKYFDRKNMFLKNNFQPISKK